MSSKTKHSGEAEWGSRFGYLMVAAGASIGLGNIWKFPYLAYRGGGGIFLVVYIIVILLLAKPVVEITARTFEIHLGWGRKKGLIIYGIGMAILNILVSLGFGHTMQSFCLT
ncbi:MAG: hypothetical protein IJJ06_05825 [Mogibacterium sp.]|nr:hypothetical protein [Mogibacterium sp.]